MKTIIRNKLELPVRRTPLWKSANTKSISGRSDLLDVICGNLPIGTFEQDFITEQQRLSTVRGLEVLAIHKYNNTDDKQKVFVWGKPFSDKYETLTDHLTSAIDPEFESLMAPLFNRTLYEFRSMGFIVEPLIDSVTLLPYPSKVCRLISVPAGCHTEEQNQCTVLHCDDFVRDGLIKKADFRLPLGFENHQYFQFSVCIGLEDGGFRPDDLFLFEKQYSAELENKFLPNKWQFPLAEVKNCRSVSYTPELRKCYFFSSLNFHDVRGGDPRSKRLNFAIFFLYIPDINTLFFYN